MRLLLNSVKKELGLDLKAEELAHKLTMAGLEVEEIIPSAPAFSGVVVGEVLDLIKHPDADKLRIATVNIGKAENLQIVCGAPNVEVGKKFPLATIGAQLPNDLKIKKGKLRGVESFGMLCSERELGLSEDHSGLWLLPDDAPVGEDIRAYLNLDEKIIDISLTPNRADCFSQRGILREIAVLYGKEFDNNYEFKNPVKETINEGIEIENQAPQNAPNFYVRLINGVNNQLQTPIFMKEELRRFGVRPHSPLVDITNFVMMKLGTPMHCYDRSKVEEKIIVRYAKEGEEMSLINGNLAKLSQDTLLIADKNKPLGIAGVMGGEFSACTLDTKEVVLECAFFTPKTVIGKARNYGVASDSAQRYERGVDFKLQKLALEWATSLIIDICGGELGKTSSATFEEFFPAQNTIKLRKSAISKRIGRTYEDSFIENSLKNLGCQVEANSEGWEIKNPSWRFDMEIEDDLIEEVARISGYEEIANSLPSNNYQKDKLPSPDFSKLENKLRAMGFNEVITYSFISHQEQEIFYPKQKALRLLNPISEEMAEMRLGLMPSLLSTLAYNRNRKQKEVRFFEIGTAFIPQGDNPQNCIQERRLGGVLSGISAPEQWAEKARELDFYDLKGFVQQLLTFPVEYQKSSELFLHPNMAADIYKNGEKIGFLGAIHPETQKQLAIKGERIFAFEIKALALINEISPKFSPISKYPSIRRDISLVVDKDLEVGKILEEIKNSAGALLKQANCFDIFLGADLGENKKSVSISLFWQDLERTLEDEEIEEKVQNLLAKLADTFGAILR